MQKIIRTSMIVLSALIFSNCSSEKFQWDNYTLEEATKLAKNKLIMIDFYANWCSPCHLLDKNTFTNHDVIQYCKENFINLKINTDTEYGYEVYKEFNVESLPKILFINSNRNIIGVINGYYGPKDYLNKIKKINKEFLSSNNE